MADTARLAAEVRAAVASISGLEATVRVRADTSGALAEAEAVRRLIESMKADIKVGASGMVGGALGDMFKGLATAGAGLPSLFGSISTGLTGIFSAGMQVFNLATGLIGKFTSLGKVATGLAGGIAGGVAAAVTAYFSMVKLGAQASQLLLVIGAVTYAFGALGAAVSALPALLFGAGLAAATVALGMDGIKRAYESNLKPALDKLKKQVSDVFEKSMKPAMAGIANALPKLSMGFQGVAFSVSAMVNNLAGVFTSVEGVKMLNQVLFNTSVFIAALTPGIRSMLTEMLKAAQVTGAFRLLGEIIGLVGEKVGDLFRRFAEGGESSLMVRSLAMLKQVLGTVIDLVSDLILKATEFFTQASPGVSKGLESIRRVVAKINFRELGDAFGIFADAVGTFFDSIPQWVWDALVNAVRDLALKFKELAEDPNVQAFFARLIFMIPVAITAFTTFLGVIRAVINYFAELGREVGVVVDWIGTKWTELVTIVSIAWMLIKNWISTKILEIQGAVALGWANIKAAISAKITEIRGDIMLKWAEIKTAIGSKIFEILGDIIVKWAQIKAAISAKITEIRTAVSTKWAEIKNAVSTRLASIVADVRAKWESVKAAVRDKVNAAKNAVRDGWSQIVNTVRQKAADVAAQARALPGKIRSALGNLGSLLVEKGKALITGLLRGIKQGVSDALAYARGIAAKIAAVKGPMSYDRKVLTPNGRALIEGFLVGLREQMATVLTYAGGIADVLRAAIAPRTAPFTALGQTVGQQIAGGIEVALAARVPALVDHYARLGQAATNADPWAAPGTVYEDGSVRGGRRAMDSPDDFAEAVARGLSGAELRLHSSGAVTISRLAARGDAKNVRR